ncbi:MAG: hypothetical protein K8S24_02955, partial [Candidatus Aegiribacteria sp.]|nr:hypothetical protein [Candidatus Aegiribacteria sp.]
EYSREMAKYLLLRESVNEIIDTINSVSAYFRNQGGWGFSQVAFELGRHAEEDCRIAQIIKELFKQDIDSFQHNFAVNICNEWLFTVRERKGSSEAAELCETILSWTLCETHKIGLLIALYRRELTHDSTAEIQMLRKHEGLFTSNGKTTEYLALLSFTASIDFKKFKNIANRLLDVLDIDEKETATYQILHTIHTLKLIHNRDSDFQLPKEISDWILSKIVNLPQMSFWNDNTMLEIDDIFKAELPSIRWLYKTLKMRLQMAASDDEFKIIPVHSRISEIVRVLPEKGDIDPDEQEAVKGMLEFIDSKDFLGYSFPEYLHDVDPYGRVVPELVAGHFKSTSNKEYKDIWKWVRIGSVYKDGSKAWRTIAESACDIAATCDERTKHKIWSSLQPYTYRSWSAPVGEVANVFYEAISDAEKRLSEEDYPSMIPFRNWVLEGVKEDLKREIERLEEDNR